MPIFRYQAKTLEGEIRSGTLSAIDKKELARILSVKGEILISAKLRKEKKDIFLFKMGKISLVDKMMFCRNLSVMVESGFAISRALNVLAKQTKNKKFKNIILEIKNDLMKGKTFSDALSKHPKIFSELFCNMVRAGEKMGKLESVLKILTLQLEKEYKLISALKGAMIYPAFIVGLMIIIGILSIILIIPKFSELFAEMGAELPITTRILMGTGNFLNQHWLAGLLIFLILLVLIIKLRQTKDGKRIIDSISLKLPIIGPIILKLNNGRTARILGSLIESGVPIIKSLEITSNTLGNVHFKNSLIFASKEISKGKTLFETLSFRKKIYSTLLIQMIAVGEETGNLSSILNKLADFYEDEVAEATKNLSSIIEPLLIVIVGLAVGFFAVSIIQPLYGIMGAF